MKKQTHGGATDGLFWSHPGSSGDVQLLHDFLERRGLLRLFLVMQSDFFAKFARIVRGRHLSPLLLNGMLRYAPRRRRVVSSSRTDGADAADVVVVVVAPAAVDSDREAPVK